MLRLLKIYNQTFFRWKSEGRDEVSVLHLCPVIQEAIRSYLSEARRYWKVGCPQHSRFLSFQIFQSQSHDFLKEGDSAMFYWHSIIANMSSELLPMDNKHRALKLQRKKRCIMVSSTVIWQRRQLKSFHSSRFSMSQVLSLWISMSQQRLCASLRFWFSKSLR